MFKIVNVYQRKLNLLNSREWAIKLVSNNKTIEKVPYLLALFAYWIISEYLSRIRN